MAKYIQRSISEKLLEVHQYYPVTVITGPRQSGKTSLCKHLFPEYNYVNLEDLSKRAIAHDDPTSFIRSLGSKAIIDEVQNVPELLSMIQVYVDENPELKYVLTGSSNFKLLHSVSQSLAGRAGLFTLLPLSLKEMDLSEKEIPTGQLLTRGQYPGIISNGIPAEIFYPNYYTTYVERDVRDIMNLKSILKFDTVVRLIAARTGSEFNASQISKEAGVSSVTVSEWLSILEVSYITFTLKPFHANIPKQLTKMPKVYFHDTGLLCYLLGIETEEQFLSSPMKGAIFENMVISELMKSRYNAGRIPDMSFYRERSGKEVDAIVTEKGKRHLYEIKAGATYRKDYSANMDYLATQIPSVDQTTVVYDGPSVPPSIINIRDI